MRLSVPHVKVTFLGGFFIVSAEAMALAHFVSQTQIAEAGLVVINWCDRYLRRIEVEHEHKTQP